MKKIAFSVLLTILAGIVASPPAMAQTHAGIRVGIGAEPEQFYFGAHADLAKVAPQFWFRPNAEVGFGDGLTVVGLNAEFVYLVPLQPGKRWTLYFGGGPAAVIRSFRAGPTGRTSDAGPGFNFLMGLQQPRGLLAEAKIGAMDSPGFKLGVGWTW